MKNLYIISNIIENTYKAYSVQIAINKGFNFLYSIFSINVDVLDDTNYFNIYFTLFGSFLNFNISLTRKTDHPGLRFSFNLLWIMIEFSLYDIRHWNDEEEKLITNEY